MIFLKNSNSRVYLSLGLIILIKIIGVAIALFVFAKFSPLIDSELYLSGHYSSDTAFRTRLINFCASGLNQVGGVYFAHFIFSFISILGLLRYYLDGGRHTIIVFSLCFPSALIWTSIVGKEAIFFGAFTGLLVIWAKYAVQRLTKIDCLIILICICTCLLLRPHYAVVMFWLFFSMGLIKSKWSKVKIFLLISWLISAFLIYLFFWNDLLYRGFGAIDPLARASRYDFFGVIPQAAVGFERFKQLLPIGLIFGVVGPFPNEVIQRFEFFPFFIEGLLILLAPFLVYRYGIMKISKNQDLFKQIFYWSLLPALVALTIMHAPFGLLNPGSAIRWRTNFESIFYLAPLLLMFQFLDKNSIENNSLSS